MHNGEIITENGCIIDSDWLRNNWLILPQFGTEMYISGDYNMILDVSIILTDPKVNWSV